MKKNKIVKIFKRSQVKFNYFSLIFLLLIIFNLNLINPVYGQISLKNISSSGTIVYLQHYENINFENIDDFGIGDNKLWDRVYALNYPENSFTQTQEQVHSGNFAAKLEALNPKYAECHIHVSRDWDINNIPDNIWEEIWVLLPADLKVDTWISFVRVYRETWHRDGGSWQSGNDYNWYKISITIQPHEEVSPGEYRLHSKYEQGYVDNDGDGLNDVGPYKVAYSSNTIKLGEWFKIKTHVYRHMTQGRYRMWLNDVLQWDLQNIRTIGISEERLQNQDGFQTYICSGFSLYSLGENGSWDVSPKYAYYDDIKLSTQELPP